MNFGQVSPYLLAHCLAHAFPKTDKVSASVKFEWEVDEYDPFSPTDYAAVLVERASAATVLAAVERAAAVATAVAAAAKCASDNATAAAADAAAAMAHAAAVMAQTKEYALADPRRGNLGFADPRSNLGGIGGFKNSTGSGGIGSFGGQSGKIERIMAKFGWVEGTGLGARGSGATTPLVAMVTSRGRGVIKPALPAAPPPSRVILLRGLVPRSVEPDDDLEVDVGDEAALAVAVCRADVSVVVFQCAPAPAPRGYGVRVFVTLPTPAAAGAAVAALNGRRFAGRLVRAGTFSEARFFSLSLAPTADEVETAAREEGGEV